MPRIPTDVRLAVVLFDIDGTLVRRAGPHHREALVQAVRDVTGLDVSMDHIPVQGMLDRDIIRRMMADRGAEETVTETNLAAIVERAQTIYEQTCPDLSDRTCPGVTPFLSALSAAKIPIGLVTGNLTRIGRRKIEMAGLGRYFSFGAFSDMGGTRTELVRIALDDARQSGWIGSATRLWLVGDHPNDVMAARNSGVRSVAVCTGVVGKDELQKYQPDLLVDDLNSIALEDLL